MAVDLTELYKQRNAINAQIEEAQKQAREAGETVIIDGKEYDSTMDFEGLLPNPVDTDYFPTYRKDDNGDITDSGEITYAELIDRFGAEAVSAVETAKDQAIQDVSDSVDNVIETQIDPKISAAEEAASAAESAKTAIDAIKTDIDETVSGFDTSVEQATSSALSDISEAKDEAISALGSKMHVGYRAIIGDGVTKSFTITHNLGSQWVFCQIWFNDLSDKCYYKLQEIDSNSIKIDFDFAPPADSVDVRIVPNVRIEDPTASLPDDFTLTKEHIDDSVECTPEEMQALIAILG